MSYLTVHIIEKYGLRTCVLCGCFVMIAGSMTRMMVYFGGSIWWWFFGHIMCMSSFALLKTPVTRLASNWFGDNERGLATSIGLVSTPLGFALSAIQVSLTFSNDDREIPDIDTEA